MFIRRAVLLICSFVNLSVSDNLSLEEVYKKALQSYSHQDWSECIIHFEEIITLHNLYKNIKLNCRHKCKSRPYKSLIQDNFYDLNYYEHLFFVSKCLIACQESEFNRVSLKNNVADSILDRIINMEPYEYLQVCYYHEKKLKKAASAAATYLIVNPDDSTVRSNLQQYIKLGKISPEEIVNLEAEKYMILYDFAMKSYSKKDWKDAVDHMENTIRKYLSSEDSCRAECEQQPEQERSSELILSFSNAIASLLDCQQRCQKRLKSIGYQSGIDFLSEALNYLQISYFNIDKIKDAAQATASFLLLKPDDEIMLENKKIYSTLTEPKSFVVRSEIQYYLKRDKYEKDLLELYFDKTPNVHSTEVKYK